MDERHSDGLIDLLHGGQERVVGCYLVETDDGPGLVDCGSAATYDALTAGLAQHGLVPADLRHLLITHIHLDHAGAAGHLVRDNPALQVHVSAIGLLYMASPIVLEMSARGVYGDRYDALWGSMIAIPEANLHPTGGPVGGLECVPTPGHASHHVCYVHPDGTLYAGDAAGVRIMPGTQITPPTLPPDIDVAAWFASIDAMAARRPARLALTHFGFADDPGRHFGRLREVLDSWFALVKSGVDESEFVRIVRASVIDQGEQVEYHRTAPMNMLYQGLRGYLDRSAGAS